MGSTAVERPSSSTSPAQSQITPALPAPSSRRFIVWTALIALIAILSFSLRGNLATRFGLAPFGRSIIPARLVSTALPSTERMTAQRCSPAEDKQWNSLATRMEMFHNHFRYEFNRLYTLCDGGFHKEGLTLPRFLREAQELAQHLDMHHRIETYIFPVLGKKMPQFKAGARESGEHLKSHKAIHEGLDKYEAFLAAALANPSTYSAATLRAIMDGFRDILFRHLDEEVRDLGAESMKAAGWTLNELRQIPM